MSWIFCVYRHLIKIYSVHLLHTVTLKKPTETELQLAQQNLMEV